jgi:hypothetical protein
MICSLTVEASKQLGAWFGGQRESGVKKEYVARCFGEFPELVFPLLSCGRTRGHDLTAFFLYVFVVVLRETIVCEEPLLTLDRQIGVNVVHPDGRVRPELPINVDTEIC